MYSELGKRQGSSFHSIQENSSIIELSNVSVNFDKKCALNDVSLLLHPGEVLFVTGASGAGKTTLLNLLAGELRPTRGRVKLPTAHDRFFSAQVFQDLRLLSQKTCEENLWFSYDKKLYTSKNNFYSELSELTKILGIYDSLHLKIANANGGMKQKIAMIRALLSRPNIILADEPTSSLDLENSRKLFEVLNFYNVKQNMTVVWATHDRSLVKEFPGKVCHLDQGKIIYSGHACFI